MQGKQEQEGDSITPWDQTNENGNGNIILRFSRRRKGSQLNSPNTPLRRNNQCTFSQILAKKKQSILNRIKARNTNEQKPIPITNIPQKVIINDELNIQTLFPSCSLRYVNRSNHYFKKEHYKDNHNLYKTKTAIETRQELNKSADAKDIYKSPHKSKIEEQQHEPQQKLSISNERRAQLIERIIMHSCRRTNRSFIKSESPQSFQQKRKESIQQRYKTDIPQNCTVDFAKTKHHHFIMLPKIQILDVSFG